MTTPSNTQVFQKQEQKQPNITYNSKYDLLSSTTIVLPDIKTNLPSHQPEHRQYTHRNMPSNSSAITFSTYKETPSHSHNNQNIQNTQNPQNNTTLHYLSPLSDIHTLSSINNPNRIHLMHRQNTFKSTSSETASSPTISYELPYQVNHSHAQSIISSAETNTTDSSQLYQYVLDMKAGGLPYIVEHPAQQESSQHSLPPSAEVPNEQQKASHMPNENSSTFTTYTHESSSTFNTYNVQQRNCSPASDIINVSSPHPSLYYKPNTITDDDDIQAVQCKRNMDQLQKRRRMQSQPQQYLPQLPVLYQTRPKSNTIQLSDISLYANNNNSNNSRDGQNDKYVRFTFQPTSSPSLQSDESRSRNSSILNTIVHSSAVDDQSTKILIFSNDTQQRMKNPRNFSFDSNTKQNDISYADYYDNKSQTHTNSSQRAPLTPCDFRGNALFENASGTPNTEFSTNAIQFSPVIHTSLKQDLLQLNIDEKHDDDGKQVAEYIEKNSISGNSDIKQSMTSPTWSPTNSVPVFVYHTTGNTHYSNEENAKNDKTTNTPTNANTNRLMCVV